MWLKCYTTVSIRRDSAKLIPAVDLPPLRPMSIDLTGAGEQDWMDGEAGPQIRYSELTTADERTSEAVEQLREPLIEVMITHSAECSAPSLNRETAGLAANMFVNYLNSQPDSSVREVFDSVPVPDTDESDWMDEYLHRVAGNAVCSTHSYLIKNIYLKATLMSNRKYIYNQERGSPVVPDFRRDALDVPHLE